MYKTASRCIEVAKFKLTTTFTMPVEALLGSGLRRLGWARARHSHWECCTRNDVFRVEQAYLLFGIFVSRRVRLGEPNVADYAVADARMQCGMIRRRREPRGDGAKASEVGMKAPAVPLSHTRRPSISTIGKSLTGAHLHLRKSHEILQSTFNTSASCLRCQN